MLPLVLFCLVFEFQVYLSKSLLALSSHPAAAILKIPTWPQVYAGSAEPTGNWDGIECGNFKMAAACYGSCFSLYSPCTQRKAEYLHKKIRKTQTKASRVKGRIIYLLSLKGNSAVC